VIPTVNAIGAAGLDRVDRRSGILAAIGRQNEGPTGPLTWVTGSAVARRMPWVDPSSA